MSAPLRLMHLTPLLLLAGACSDPGKGLGGVDTSLGQGDTDDQGDDDDDDDRDPPGFDTDEPDTDTDEPDTDEPDTDTDPPFVCPAGPTGGPVPTLADCEFLPNPSGTPFAARIEWAMTNETVDPTTGAVIPAYTFSDYPAYGSVFQAPVVAQVTDDNGDGLVNENDIPDIAVLMAEGPTSSYDAALRLISGDGSKVHASIMWAWHTNANGTQEYAPYRYAGVAVGNIDSDAHMEIATVVVSRASADAAAPVCYPAIYEVNQVGGNVTLRLDRVYGGGSFYCGGHAPAFADLDGNGSIEVILGRAVMDSDLNLRWAGTGGRAWYGRPDYPYPDGYWNSGYHSFAYDMDGDGTHLEVVAGRTVYTHTGARYCDLGKFEGGVWVDATDGYPAVADILRFPGDSPGEPEIVITGNEYVTVFRGSPDANGRCHEVARLPNRPEADPTVPAGLPSVPECDTPIPPHTWPPRAFGGPPTIADFNGDGKKEIGVAGSCWFSVFKFDTSNNMYRYAMHPTKDFSSASTGSTVFDFDGDGANEIVFNDEEAVYVWGLNDAVGLAPWQRLVTLLQDDGHKSWTIHEYPLVADVDNDGKAEIIVVNSYLPEYPDRYGIYVLGAADDDWVSSRQLWNQHAYHITNIGDDGSLGYCPPNYAPYTAEDYNSFRTQAPGSFGALAAPNLRVEADLCQDTCGEVVVWLQPYNEGAYISTSPDVILALYGVDASGGRHLLGHTSLGMPLPPGTMSDAYEFTVTGIDQWTHLEVVIDDASLAGVGPDGVAKECDETDNTAILSLAGLCL